jgi:hypothetical protein
MHESRKKYEVSYPKKKEAGYPQIVILSPNDESESGERLHLFHLHVVGGEYSYSGADYARPGDHLEMYC